MFLNNIVFGGERLVMDSSSFQFAIIDYSRLDQSLNWGDSTISDNPNFLNIEYDEGFGNFHLMSKDILITHSVYWPTMLMAAKVPLPQTIFSHGWWLMENTKMSKSLGNVVNPLDIIDNYGVDPLRYYLMRDMVLGQDASYSFDSFVKRYNSDLANDFGNLVNRVTILIRKHFHGVIPKSGNYCEIDLELIALAKATPQKVEKSIQEMRIHDALEYTIALFRKMNVYLECKAPWKTIITDNNQI